MAAIDHSAYVSPPAFPFEGTAALLKNAKRSVRAYIAYHQTRDTLGRLSQRQLADIGLEGANIDLFSREMAKRNVL